MYYNVYYVDTILSNVTEIISIIVLNYFVTGTM